VGQRNQKNQEKKSVPAIHNVVSTSEDEKKFQTQKKPGLAGLFVLTNIKMP
jgi:hypothetical protein